MKNPTSIRSIQQPLPQQIIGEFNGFTVEVCLHPNSLRTACRLRYRAYLAANAVAENEAELIQDQYDDLPGSFVYLVWYEGRPVATIRSCVYSDAYDWEPTEAVGYFTPAINICLGQDQRLIESNRFAVDPDFQGRQSIFAQMLLFRMHALNAAVHGCEHIITAVRLKHIPFYRRFLGMKQVSTDAKYVTWANAHVALMVCDRAESLAIAVKKGLPPVSQQDVDEYLACISPQSGSFRQAA